MQTTSGADESQRQADWMGSFVTIMKGEPSLSDEKLHEALAQILENRLQGSSVSQMLIEKSKGNEWLLREISSVYVELNGVKDVASRVGLLGTFYMKSLTETMDACKVPSPCDERGILEKLKAYDAKELYDNPEIRRWLSRYCFESSRKSRVLPDW